MKYLKHYEEAVDVVASAEDVFNYVDDHLNFSSHMNKSSAMMGGGMMKTEFGKGGGKTVGSHIKMSGRVFGIDIYLDEVVTVHNPPFKKTWETVGIPNLLVIGDYEMGFEITEIDANCNFKVFINYNLPNGIFTKFLGMILGRFYAKWCVHQMIQSTSIFTKS